MITLTVNAASGAELQALLAGLVLGVDPRQPGETDNSPENTSTPAVESKPRGRPKKDAEPKAEAPGESAPAAEAAQPATPATAPAPTPGATTASPSDVTYANVQAAVAKLVGQFGPDEGGVKFKNILGNFGVDHGTKLKPEQWSKVIEQVNSVLNAASLA